jgi:hypothetical protein
MYDLIDYLLKDECLVFVGAGPSCEVGLPNWERLTGKILEEVRTKNPKDIDAYEVLFAQQKFQELIGKAWNRFSSDFVLSVCKAALADTNVVGPTYSFLTKHPFRGYITTNLDSILLRHLEHQGIAATEFINTKSDLETVDFGEFTCIVKIHGNCNSAETVVLTAEQYDAVVYDPKFEYLRSFLRAHLTASRILFVGYSLRDSDIQFLAQLSRYALKRKTPLYAIVANASDEVIDEWDRKYNIRLVSYRDTDGSHVELRNVIEVIGKYLSVRGEDLPASSVPLEVAQGLYMWHRFQQEGGEAARADAFCSLLLAAISEWRKPGELFDVREVTERVAKLGRMDAAAIGGAVHAALVQVSERGFVQKVGDRKFSLTKEGEELNRKNSDSFNALKTQFEKQVVLDLSRVCPGASGSEIGAAKAAVLDVLTAAFSQRGAEITQMVFGQEREVRPAPSLFKIINTSAERLSHELRYPFMGYLTEILTQPKGVQERFLEYLAKAFFVVQALGLDPDGNRVRRALLSNHTFVVDSNVLIPALAKGSARNRFIAEVFSKSQLSGLRFIVTPDIHAETMSHISWAQKLVSQFGEQSLEILSAALGRGHYRQNAFLDGYIRYSTDVRGLRFDEYLEECFGEPVSYKAMKITLEKIGVHNFSPSEITKSDLNYFVTKEEVKNFLEASVAQRADVQKTEYRIEAEAEVYAVIESWSSMPHPDSAAEDWKCSFLTYAGFLNRVAHEGPVPVHRNIIVRPDVLYEFLGHLEPFGRFDTPFKDVLLSSYFRAADYFIDKSKYARFFGPLLRHAEEIYKGSLEQFRHVISSALTEESILEIEELERPFAVASLNSQVDDVLRQEANRLADENAELRKELQKLKMRGSRKRRKGRR